MAEPLTLYKLIVLYMLSRVDFPLTKAQIGDFILEREYTNFLTLQQAIGELIDAGLVLTKDGSQTLNFFSNQISPTIKEEIDEFFKQNEIAMRNEVSILADYYKSTTGEFESHLVAKDKGINLIDITISVPDETTAASICDNWQKKNQDIYQYIVAQLF